MSKRWVPYNLNYDVRVRLTELGRRRYIEHWASYGIDKEPTEDADGWFQCQMSELMRIFGDMMCMGSTLPFSCQVEIALPIDRTIVQQIQASAEEALFE